MFNDIRARFIIPVATVVLLTVLGGAMTLSRYSITENSSAASDESSHQLGFLSNLLLVTNSSLMAQVKGSMNMLIQRSSILGAGSSGTVTEIVPNVYAPELKFGVHNVVNNPLLVDEVTNLVGGTATIFSRFGNDFIRVSTTIRNENEQRVLGTLLSPSGRAIAELLQGKSYYGQIDILGRIYVSGYEPIRNSANDVIGAYYVGYAVSMDQLKDIIKNSNILKSGFLAVVDDTGKVRFTSDSVDLVEASRILKDPTGWEITSTEFAPWKFNIVAAYSKAEITEMSGKMRNILLLVGLTVCGLLTALLYSRLHILVTVPIGGEPTEASYIACKLAAGDLTVDIPVSEGDRRSVMSALSVSRREAVRVVNTLKTAITSLTSTSENIIEMSRALSTGVAQQTYATSDLEDALDQISQSIQAAASEVLYREGDRPNLVQQVARDEIARNVKYVSKRNAENTAIITNVINDAKQLQLLITELRHIVGNFKL